MIASAGFENLVEKTIKTPVGGWAQDPTLRELGQWALLGFDIGLEGYAMATLTRVLGVRSPTSCPLFLLVPRPRRSETKKLTLV
jgi:hypothetical protein